MFDSDQEITVLLVDDDAEQRDYLAAKFLQVHKCRIISAENPDQALELVQKHDPHVVVSDFLMAGGTGTGVDLLRAINTLREHKPVMMLVTGFPDFLPDHTFNSEIATIFCKPFNAERLVKMALEKLGIRKTEMAA